MRDLAKKIPIAGREAGTVVVDAADYRIERLTAGRIRVTIDDGRQITIHEGTRASVIARCNIDAHPRFRAALAAAVNGAPAVVADPPGGPRK